MYRVEVTAGLIGLELELGHLPVVGQLPVLAEHGEVGLTDVKLELASGKASYSCPRIAPAARTVSGASRGTCVPVDIITSGSVLHISVISIHMLCGFLCNFY